MGRDFFSTNPDRADILGDVDLDFESFIFDICVGFQISGFPGSQISKIHVAQNVGKVWTSRKKSFPAPFEAIPGNFFHGPKNNVPNLHISQVPKLGIS